MRNAYKKPHSNVSARGFYRGLVPQAASAQHGPKRRAPLGKRVFSIKPVAGISSAAVGASMKSKLPDTSREQLALAQPLSPPWHRLHSAETAAAFPRAAEWSVQGPTARLLG